MPRAVIYARFSSHNQRDESIEQQVAECRVFAKSSGLTVVDVYADAAISGRSDRRPQFQRLRRDAGKGLFDTIIAYKSSRIARNMLNALTFEVEMTKLGINVVYAKEEFGNTAAGRFALRTMMSVNQFYSENLGEDIRRTQADNARQCKANGPAPYGYKSGADGRFEIDEPAASIVREIYARVAAGETNSSIMQDFNARHIHTRSGKPWKRHSFQGILGNERYLGIYIFDDVRVPGGMPQIVDEELYREAMIMSKGRKNKNPAAEYQLTGKLYCGECGELMTGMCGTGKAGTTYRYYACAGRRAGTGCKKEHVPQSAIESAVARALMSQIMSDEIIDQIADEVMEYQRRHKDSPEIKALEAEKAETAKAIKNILSAMEAGIFTESTKTRLLELEAKSTEVSERLRMLTAEQINVTRDQVVGYLKSFRGGDIEDRAYRLQLFHTFLVRAYVYDDRLRIVFDPLGSGNSEAEISLSDLGAGESVRPETEMSHQICLTQTPYIVITLPFAVR